MSGMRRRRQRWMEFNQVRAVVAEEIDATRTKEEFFITVEDTHA